jgi:hypothetical protein
MDRSLKLNATFNSNYFQNTSFGMQSESAGDVKHFYTSFFRILISFATSYAPARFYKTGQPRGKHKGEKREGIILVAEGKLSLFRRCRTLLYTLFLLQTLFLRCKSAVVASPTTDIMRLDESLLSHCHFL